jgi:uridylate kinase
MKQQSVSNAASVYRRILLKFSGEALMGPGQFGIDPQTLDKYATDIAGLCQLQVQVGIVIGGGNLFRGAELSEAGLGRVTGDYMGMLATMMNALALRDALDRAGLDSRMMSALPMPGVIDVFERRKAIHHLRQGRPVIFAGGIGSPCFTTDSAASLRGIEIEAELLVKATKVDGIYDSDPSKNAQAVKYEQLSYAKVLNDRLNVMDATAICLCRDYQLPIRVVNINEPGTLKRLVLGEHVGTLVNGL